MTIAEFLGILLGILAVIASGVAICIAVKSDRIIKSIFNLNFDEKIAMMSMYNADIKLLRTIASTERIKNDFVAVSNLKYYASDDRKEKLIIDYVIPIIDSVLGLDGISTNQAVLLNDIIGIALDYNIKREEIIALRLKLMDKYKLSNLTIG